MAEQGLSAQDIAFQLGHTDGGRLAPALYVHTYAVTARDRVQRAYGGNVATLRALPDASQAHGVAGTA